NSLAGGIDAGDIERQAPRGADGPTPFPAAKTFEVVSRTGNLGDVGIAITIIGRIEPARGRVTHQLSDQHIMLHWVEFLQIADAPSIILRIEDFALTHDLREFLNPRTRRQFQKTTCRNQRDVRQRGRPGKSNGTVIREKKTALEIRSRLQVAVPPLG